MHKFLVLQLLDKMDDSKEHADTWIKTDPVALRRQAEAKGIVP